MLLIVQIATAATSPALANTPMSQPPLLEPRTERLDQVLHPHARLSGLLARTPYPEIGVA
jgi:hypothetical protein